MINITITKYRLGGFEGEVLLDDLSDYYLKLFGLYWTKARPDLQLTLSVEGSYEPFTYGDGIGVEIHDLSIQIPSGEFIYLANEEFNYNELCEDIVKEFRAEIEEDLQLACPEPLDK